MRVRQLSSTGDYAFGNGQANFLINSPAAVAQVVETAFKLWLGEWYLNTAAGMPWLEEVFGYNSKEDADQALINYALTIQGVENISNWNSTVNAETRAYTSITATIDTIYGQTQLQMENLGAL